jgi:hypothetical protein
MALQLLDYFGTWKLLDNNSNPMKFVGLKSTLGKKTIVTCYFVNRWTWANENEHERIFIGILYPIHTNGIFLTHIAKVDKIFLGNKNIFPR